jgi:hypothetical protein
VSPQARYRPSLDFFVLMLLTAFVLGYVVATI